MICIDGFAIERDASVLTESPGYGVHIYHDLEALRETGMIQRILKIEYDPDVDILTLWNGNPASNGSAIAEGLMVFLDEEDEPQIVTLEGASKLLGPLFGQHAAH